MRRGLSALVAATVGVIGLAAPAMAMRPCPQEDSTGPCHWNAQAEGNGVGHSFTAYPHHRLVYGEDALTGRQVRRVERIVRHLPRCWTNQPTDCRVFLRHRHTLASFQADGLIYYVRLNHGRLAYEETYRAR